MLKLADDEDFNNRIVRGLLRREPDLDLKRVQDARLRAKDDSINLVESDFKEEVLDSKLPVLVFVGATYNSAFISTKPIIEEVAREYVNKIKVVMLDRSVNNRLAEKLGASIDSVIVLYIRGKERKRIVGAASKNAVVHMLKETLLPLQ